MQKIDRNLVLHAVCWLVIGMLFGFWIGATNRLQLGTVHVTMLLPGFVTLAIYGFIYRLWPELKEANLARIQYLLAVGAVPFLVIGSYIQVQTGGLMLLVVSSAAAIISALMLTWLFFTKTHSD